MDKKDYDQFVFENVNRWLDFAERKNAFLFSVFSTISLLSIVVNATQSLDFLLKIGITIFIGLYLASLFFTLLSLFPTTTISKNILKNGKNRKITDSDNLFFYGDISKYSFEEYKSAINRKYGIGDTSSKMNDDLLEQIITNSNIAFRKYACFRISVVCLFIAIVQLFIFITITIY